jgi:hypothetical protein
MLVRLLKEVPHIARNVLLCRQLSGKEIQVVGPS